MCVCVWVCALFCRCRISVFALICCNLLFFITLLMKALRVIIERSKLADDIISVVFASFTFVYPTGCMNSWQNPLLTRRHEWKVGRQVENESCIFSLSLHNFQYVACHPWRPWNRGLVRFPVLFGENLFGRIRTKTVQHIHMGSKSHVSRSQQGQLRDSKHSKFSKCPQNRLKVF